MGACGTASTWLCLQVLICTPSLALPVLNPPGALAPPPPPARAPLPSRQQLLSRAAAAEDPFWHEALYSALIDMG